MNSTNRHYSLIVKLYNILQLKITIEIKSLSIQPDEINLDFKWLGFEIKMGKTFNKLLLEICTTFLFQCCKQNKKIKEIIECTQ
ncbi:hypothetical protein BpHYR1_024973 [Brachionus plicatilis]|uniref:Uncharacterized protein n=1 Tax=Brachionus plicatilis TaxID=10195 RepID=A0A3M7SAF4_BRAPC|nr:hypothetical protein BpHYR1_024973 [Brachionus plicatilis]